MSIKGGKKYSIGWTENVVGEWEYVEGDLDGCTTQVCHITM